jgi:ferredoxin
MGDDGKASLKDAKDVGSGKFELECEDPGCCKEAISSCPVQIISIE